LRQREHHPGDRGSLVLDSEGASSWRRRVPNPGDIGSLTPGDIGSLILETEGA